MCPETVGNTGNQLISKDTLLNKQREDVAKMRASLLCCSEDPYQSTVAMQNITVLRVYHQMSRIIRYLDLMDKLEDKLYQSIECQIEKMDIQNTSTWMMLLNMQERLQKNIIESHKILQPYLNVQEFNIKDLSPVVVSANSEGDSILSRESRDKLRSSAQQVLAILGPIDGDADGTD